MAETQLKDYLGRNINPKTEGGGTPSSMEASEVHVAGGTGLSSTNVQGALGELNDKIETSSGGDGIVFDMATGNKDESCLVNDSANAYVSSIALSVRPFADNNQDVVVMAHDDLPEEDYVGSRKIHNKYNFKATFNYILNPFTSAAYKTKRITNIKRMIADGHEIGLHAILDNSFFWRNLMYDVTPDSNALFSPNLAEMKTVVANSKNVFGITIDANSTFNTVKHGDDSSIANVKLSEATQAQWFTAVSYYNAYACPYSITGLDLNDQNVTKTYLGWLEYWYNELIDNTLGYSTYTGTIAERFAADYSGTYPDASHVISGELSSYGTFTKGLFKGCHTCCNYEVLDRIISVAEAFCRRYFGLSFFSNMAYHGAKFAALYWTGSDGALYNDRGCNILATGHTKVFVSAKNRLMNLFDIVLSHGIKMIKRHYPADSGAVNGQLGLYKGQKDIRGCYFNNFSPYYHHQDYLALLGTSTSSTGQGDDISYQTLIDCMPSDYADWAKFAYEHAGQQIATGVYMLTFYKQVIDRIRACSGTNKIAFIGVDTIGKKPSVTAAVEMVCQYCYKHNKRIVTAFEGMTIANKDVVIDNAYPNPSFKQSLLDDFGGSSTSEEAYLPDGYIKLSGTHKTRVTTEGGNKVLTISDVTVGSHIETRVYGLPSGHYKFTAMAKTNNTFAVKVYKALNSTKTSESGTLLHTLTAGNADFEEISCEFDIPAPHRNTSGSGYVHAVCDGYEDNVAYIAFSLEVGVGKTLSIYNPRIDKIENEQL